MEEEEGGLMENLLCKLSLGVAALTSHLLSIGHKSQRPTLHTAHQLHNKWVKCPLKLVMLILIIADQNAKPIPG